MNASWYGHFDIVRTLLEGKANLNVKSNVRNQMMMMMMMMMMMIIIILLTILMMMMMMKIVINDEDRDDCR